MWAKLIYFIYIIIGIFAISMLFLMVKNDSDFTKNSGAIYKTILILILLTGLLVTKNKTEK